MADRIELSELETYLYHSADILRTHVDASDYKMYVFPLLFFKRICDVYDEETEKKKAELGDAFFFYPEKTIHRFSIPEGCHWRDVRNATENIGVAIVDAFRGIEDANGSVLQGVFGHAAWTNKNRLPDETLKNLIEHFSSKTLTLDNCPEDELGQAYEYLIKKFGDDSGHTSQEFYTNRTVVHLMTEMLKPQPGETIYDPTCGSAGMLISCIAYLKEKGLEWRNVKCYGQEINELSSSIGKMNLFLHGVEYFEVVNDDTLKRPAFVDHGELRQFDLCLANPPYSISTWNRDAFEHDPYGRNFLGTPPQGRADYAFIQHIIKSLNPNSGRCAILLPHGVLNRSEEADIRLKLVQMDIVEAVIGLGRHLFYNSGLESCILVCRMNKPASQRNKILFIEAEKYQHRVKGQSYLYEEDIDTILDAYNSLDDIPGLSKYVSVDDIVENGGNLNIKSYVKTDNGSIPDDELESLFCDHLDNFLISTETYRKAISSFFPSVGWGDFDVTKTAVFTTVDKSNWTRVKLGDVAEEYSERVIEPSESPYEWYIGSDCIDGFDFRIARKTPSSKIHSTQKAFKPGDYLLVRRSLYGSDFRERAPRADFSGVCSADILTIREKEDIVADGFLIAVLYSKRLWDFIVSNSTGSLTRRIKWSQLKEFEFLLPPITIQEEVSDILWSAYEAKSALMQVLTLTDELVKSQFIEMFGDPIINPRSLQVKKLSELATLITKGASPTWQGYNYTDDSTQTLFVTSENVREGSLDLNEPKYLEDGFNDKQARSVLKKGDFLINIVGASIGRAARFDLDVKANINQAVALVRMTDEVVTSEYMMYYLNSPKALEMYDAMKSAVARANLSLQNIGDLEILIPSKDEQIAFSAFLKQSDKSKFELKQHIDAIDGVIRTLSQIIVS